MSAPMPPVGPVQYHNANLATYVLQLQQQPLNASRLPLDPTSLIGKEDGDPIMLALGPRPSATRIRPVSNTTPTGASNRPTKPSRLSQLGDTAGDVFKGAAIGGLSGTVVGIVPGLVARHALNTKRDYFCDKLIEVAEILDRTTPVKPANLLDRYLIVPASIFIQKAAKRLKTILSTSKPGYLLALAIALTVGFLGSALGAGIGFLKGTYNSIRTSLSS